MTDPDYIFRYPMQGLGGRVFRPVRRRLEIRDAADRTCWQVVQRRRLLCATSDVLDASGQARYTVTQPGLDFFGTRRRIHREGALVGGVRASLSRARIRAEGLPATRMHFGHGLRREFPVVTEQGCELAVLRLLSGPWTRCGLWIADPACHSPVLVLAVALASDEMLIRG